MPWPWQWDRDLTKAADVLRRAQDLTVELNKMVDKLKEAEKDAEADE